MGKKFLTLMLVLLVGLVNGGGCNLFTDMSIRTSDEAIIDDINNLMDKSLWNDAVQKLSLISATGRQRRNVLSLSAAAYAGRGGLDTINLIASLNNGASGPLTLLQQLMASFPKSTVGNYNDQLQAQTFMFTISTNAAARTVDENIFLVFVEFAKLGTLLSSIADLNHDTVLDPAFDNCNHAMVTDAQANEVIVGIAVILGSLAAAGSSIASGSLSNASSICALAAALGPTFDFCSTSDPNAVTVAQRQVARTLIGETNSSLGLKVLVNAATFEFQPPMNVPPGNLCP